MRYVAILLIALLAGSAYAESVKPIASLTAPAGRFFDDAMAFTLDGKTLALVSTDAASPSSLHVWTPETHTELRIDGLPNKVAAVHFLTSERVLIISQRDDELLTGAIVSLKNGQLILEKSRLRPAEKMGTFVRGGNSLIWSYRQKRSKSGLTHEVDLYSGPKNTLSQRRFVEDADGLIRAKANRLRPLWWNGEQLAAQKIGEYDKARDMRLADRFVRLDLVSMQLVVDDEISELLGFAQVVALHRAKPWAEVFAQVSEDHKALQLVDGLSQPSVTLSRPLAVYDLNSVWSVLPRPATVMLGLQVDPNNADALARKQPDADDLDLYALDRASLNTSTPLVRRVLVLPGQGRAAAFVAAASRVAVLRKGKGFDRGGVVVDLFDLP